MSRDSRDRGGRHLLRAIRARQHTIGWRRRAVSTWEKRFGDEVPTLLRRRCLIGLDMRPGLDSPNDGREILLETYEMLAAE